MKNKGQEHESGTRHKHTYTLWIKCWLEVNNYKHGGKNAELWGYI